MESKKINLLSYINQPLSKESIAVLYSANNIKFERCELYSDFVQSLLLIVFDTYLGDDITNHDEQIKHFSWCWNKNIDNFKKEGITFNNNALYSYFLEFMLEVFYPLTKKDENKNNYKNILNLWLFTFDFTVLKTNSDIDTLIEIYQLFEKSLINQ